MYSLKDDIEAMFLNSPDKVRAKKKLNELFDKYGESRRAVENGTTDTEFFEYIMASAYEKEVLEERREARIGNEEKKPQEKYDNVMLLREDMEERKKQSENDNLLNAIEASEHEKETIIDEFKSEHEKYKSVEIDSMKRQANRLMNIYGEDLDISYMSSEDAHIYMSVKSVIDDVKRERMYDEDVKKNKNLEYSLRDNFTPLKEKLSKDTAFRKIIESAEDIVDYPYLDSEGLKTSGIGYLVNDKDVFINQPWLYENDDGTRREATEKQKIEGYNQLLFEAEKLRKKYEEERRKNPSKQDKGAFNYKHTYYKDKTRLRLPKDFIEQEYQRQVNEALKRVKTSFDRYNKTYPENKIKYEKIPSDILIALSELSYNIGHFNVRFKKMLDSIAVQDYEAAAKYSERENPNQSETVKERIKYLATVLRRHSKK